MASTGGAPAASGAASPTVATPVRPTERTAGPPPPPPGLREASSSAAATPPRSAAPPSAHSAAVAGGSAPRPVSRTPLAAAPAGPPLRPAPTPAVAGPSRLPSATAPVTPAPARPDAASPSSVARVSRETATPTPPPASASAPRRAQESIADAVAMAVGAKKERKRKRIHYSCAECHRRKHKCDRNTPCQACIDRGLADSCRPFEEGDQHGDVRDRVARLEDLVEGLAKANTGLAAELSAMRRAVGLGAPPSRADADSGALGALAAAASAAKGGDSEDEKPSADERARRVVRIASSRSLGMEREELRRATAASGDGRSASLYGAGDDDPPGGAVGANPLEGGLTREGDSFYGALALPSVSRGIIETRIHGERLELSSNVPLRSASVKVRRLIQEGGAHPDVVNELMENLPSRAESDQMLLWYFRDINVTRLPLHEQTFRQSYEELMDWKWGTAKEEEGDDGARHLPFLSFLYVILAIAKRNQPEDLGSDADAKAGALKLFHTARRTMAVASAVRADHIDVLLAALFGCRFLICLRMSAESWSLLGSAIRAAQAIGLHRDGTKLGLDAVTTERRRRLWALIYYLDKTTSMLLGRPQGINDQNCDTLAPSDVDIDTLPRYGPAPTPEAFPPPAGVTWPKRPPGVFMFVAIRHELAKLTGRVVEHFQNLSKPRNYADVLAIDADLQRFVDALPAPYRCEQMGGSDHEYDAVCPWLPLHRYLINVEQLYIRITLHRPYLLRSDRYAQSRVVAFASAKTDRQIRTEYKRDVKWPSNRARSAHMGGLYRLFNAALVAGIQLLLEPQSPEAPELHAALDDFLALKSNEPADTSQCTKREVAIIQLFQSKSRDPSWCAATATGARSRGGARSSGTSLAHVATTRGAAAASGSSRGGKGSTSASRDAPSQGSRASAMESPPDSFGARGPAAPHSQSVAPNAGLGGPPLAPLAEWPAGVDPGTSSTSSFAPMNVDAPLGAGLAGPSSGSAPSRNSDALAQDLFDQLGAGALDSFGLDQSPFSWDDGGASNGFTADGLDQFWAAATNGNLGGNLTLHSPHGNAPIATSRPAHEGSGMQDPSVSLTPWGGLIEAIVSGQGSQHHFQQQDSPQHSAPSNAAQGPSGSPQSR